jgi:hypothetical protein
VFWINDESSGKKFQKTDEFSEISKISENCLVDTIDLEMKKEQASSETCSVN